jgi:hypothetical protein|uniref:Uncharacterized protein n=1 Tax=Siphoviridae sp. ctK0l2 TaxID=2826243 RepID=A0A8S5NKF6_9CAUD|nr:MAG TPA: hypothetical protein [Siphoviridae sp. ctK0l2]
MPVYSKIAKKIQNEIDTYLMNKDLLDGYINLSKTDKHKESFSVNKNYDGEDGYMTLLSEGSVLYPDGSIRLYLAKGTLQKWYDSIDEEYEGYVTVGHVDTNSFPVRQGYFRKEDLRIITDDKGRSDLLVKPHVNTELSQIKDLIIQDEPFAISSEFSWTFKDIKPEEVAEYTKLTKYNAQFTDEPVPITDNIHITGFSFVGNPGNAKSGGYEPSVYLKQEKELELDKENTLDKILAYFNGQSAEATEVEEKQPEVVEEVVEEVKEEVAEPAVEAEAEATEQAEEVKEESLEASTVELLEKATAKILELEAKVGKLEAEKVALEQEKAQSEGAIKQRMETLSALLSKASVEAPVVKEQEEKLEQSTGLRKRFGGK